MTTDYGEFIEAKKARELLTNGQPMHAQAIALVGILEELKTINHILASIYLELKPESMTQPEPRDEIPYLNLPKR